jgi:hypothetical protein
MTVISISHLLQSSFLSESNVLQTLGEEFHLCENGNMVFHWADFSETCDVIRMHLENEPHLMEDFKKREASLTRLQQIPVWIRTQSRVHQTTMYDLYEKFLVNHSQLLGVNPFGPIEISFISGTGPFKSMAIAECFNNTTYKDFVLVYLLKDKLPKRDYRIRLKSKVLLEYGQNFEKAHLVQLEQLTTRGLLISMDANLYNFEMSHGSEVRFLIDAHVMGQACNKSLPELQSYLSQFAFNLMYSSRKEDAIYCNLGDLKAQLSFDYFKNKKVFIFVPYAKLKSETPGSVASIENFVQYTKELVRSHYCKDLKVKSA